MHTADTLILASGSEIRATLLRNAGVRFDVVPVHVDEEAVKASLIAEGAGARDIADTLAEIKAAKGANASPGAMVLGCDQVLEFEGRILSKPETEERALDDLMALRGKSHRLHSAAVIHDGRRPVWRHVEQAELTMHDVDFAWAAAYVSRNWPAIASSVGGYRIEEEGAQLFSRIDGDHFVVQGLPLLQILAHLTQHGTRRP